MPSADKVKPDSLNKWLNNGKRVARKRKEFQTLVGLKEKLK